MSLLPPPWSDETPWGLTKRATALLTVIFPKDPEERKRPLSVSALFDKHGSEMFELQLTKMFRIEWEPGDNGATFLRTEEGRAICGMALADSAAEYRRHYEAWCALYPPSGQSEAELLAELMMLTADARRLERELADSMSELRGGKGAAA